MKSIRQLSVIEKIYLGILLIIFGGIVFHAPLSVWVGSIAPSYEMVIKLWKELLMFVAAVIAIMILREKKKFEILQEPLMKGIKLYAILHIFLLLVFWQGLAPSVAGLMIDLRYLLFFVLVFIAIRLYPNSRRLFVRIGIAGALIALIFALLQVFILPIDVLKNIGYNTQTIAPYMTVDQNHDFIRINGTFRGPNPLGAYAAIVLTILVAFVSKHRVNKNLLQVALFGILAIGGIVSLWASYSRGALLAACAGIIIVLGTIVGRKLPRYMRIICLVLFLAIVGGLIVNQGNSFISNVLLHENPGEGSSINSNQAHVQSIQDGLTLAQQQPFGAGVGSTGSASLYGSNSPLIIENQYLFITHESGWVGLILFLLIFVGVLNRLWQKCQDYLALGVFASGIGLALIGLFLPVWVDDSVAIIWWGLAAILLGDNRYE